MKKSVVKKWLVILLCLTMFLGSYSLEASASDLADENMISDVQQAVLHTDDILDNSAFSGCTIISNNNLEKTTVNNDNVPSDAITENETLEEIIKPTDKINGQTDIELNTSSDETVEDMPIKMPDGTEYNINDFNEDYVAFFFGRGTCGNTSIMTSVAETAYAGGTSIKIVMMDIDQKDDNVKSFQEEHPYAMVSYTPESYINLGWMWDFIRKYNLDDPENHSVSLPCTVIFDKKHDLVFGSVGCKYEELSDFLKIVWVQGLNMGHDGDKYMHRYLHTGDSIELSATISPENATDKRLTWSSSDENVIKVDKKGKITAVGEGDARITVKAMGYKPRSKACSAFVDFYVDDSYTLVSKVTLDKTNCKIGVGKTVKLSASVSPENAINKIVWWTSEDESVATVDWNGEVIGISEGVTTITAIAGNCKAICTVTVGNGKKVVDAGEIIRMPSKNAVVKEKIELSSLFGKEYDKYTVLPKENAMLVNQKTLKIKKTGNIQIIAYAETDEAWVKSAIIDINLEKPVFSEKVVEVTKVGRTINSAEILNGTTIKPDKWTTSKATVAKIDELTGKVEVVGNGSARITAEFGTGKNAAKYYYTVRAKTPTLSKKKANIKTGAVLKLKVKNTSAPSIWRSSDDNIATVDQTGRVVAHKYGTVIITANIDDADYDCMITVKKPEINKSEVSINMGKKTRLRLKNTKLKSVDWKSSNESVAYVDNRGTVHGMSQGTAIISTDAGGFNNSCIVTVN